MKHDQKKEAILQAAVKRFSHFTVAKTTMSEIAKDLGISKSLLYYYFPDKLMLYGEVIQYVINKIINSIDTSLFEHDNPMENCMRYINLRKGFVIEYYNIFSYAQTAIEKAPEDVTFIFQTARNVEYNIICKILESGKKAKKLAVADISQIAHLFLDCLEGLRHVFFLKDGIMFPEKEQFEQVFKQEKDFVQIFIKGITI